MVLKNKMCAVSKLCISTAMHSICTLFPPNLQRLCFNRFSSPPPPPLLLRPNHLPTNVSIREMSLSQVKYLDWMLKHSNCFKTGSVYTKWQIACFPQGDIILTPSHTWFISALISSAHAKFIWSEDSGHFSPLHSLLLPSFLLIRLTREISAFCENSCLQFW